MYNVIEERNGELRNVNEEPLSTKGKAVAMAAACIRAEATARAAMVQSGCATLRDLPARFIVEEV